MFLVHAIVRQYGSGICASIGIEQADLVQEGAVALVHAANRFDSERGLGATFRSFCSHRVRGAIIDYLRAQKVASRSVLHAKLRSQELEERYMRAMNRMPTDNEYCSELGYEHAQWQVLRVAMNTLLPAMNFDSPSHWNDYSYSDNTIGDIALADPDAVEAMVERMETITEVRNALKKLPPAQEAALRGKYFDRTLARDTARVLGVKPDRITRLNRQGLAALRESLAHLRPVGVPFVETIAKKPARVKRGPVLAVSDDGSADNPSA